MANQERPVPVKLKRDAIVEALLEIRFDTTTIPEIFFGRVADHSQWKGFEQRQLPFYQIPAHIRQSDINLRFTPVFELLNPNAVTSVRLGPQVLSYHHKAPYSGWSIFRPELLGAVDALFANSSGIKVRRIGLRYLNALTEDAHQIHSISDLDLKLIVAGETVSGRVNINFTKTVATDTDCTVRIATKEFVQGDLPQHTSVVVDMDVFTTDHFAATDPQVVKQWVDVAHTKEKEQFFSLLTDESLAALVER